MNRCWRQTFIKICLVENDAVSLVKAQESTFSDNDTEEMGARVERE